MNSVYVPLRSNIGNSMFAFMMGGLLHRRTGARLHLRGHGLADFGIRGVSTLEHGYYRARWWLRRATFHNVRKGPEHTLQTAGDRLAGSGETVLVAWPLKPKIHLYRPYRDYYNTRLRPARSYDGFGDEFLLVNIRLGDIARGRHDNYSPLPLSWYRHLQRETGKQLVFMGQLDDGYYSSEVRRQFPDAIFLRHESPLKDFEIIRNSIHIVLSVSTFTYLAAWLSETARTIYYPMWGLYDPATRKDIDLLPDGDSRYVVYGLDFRKVDANRARNPLVDPGWEPFQRAP